MTTTYLFAGDSLTEGRIGESFVERVTHALALDRAGLRGRCINAGRSCETVRSLLERIDSLLEEHHPDWVILAVGTNDIWLPWLASKSIGWWLWLQIGRLRGRQLPTVDLDQFTASYRLLVDRVLSVPGTRVLVCTPSPLGERLASLPNQRMARLTGAIKHLAVERGLPVADVWQGFVQEIAAQPRTSRYLPVEWLGVWLDRRRLKTATPDEIAHRRRLRLTFDGIHLNSRGADLWAATILYALAAVPGRHPQAGPMGWVAAAHPPAGASPARRT